MGLNLAQALRVRSGLDHPVVAFVGAGGKTTAMFQTARDLEPPVIATATTHMGQWQLSLADRHIVAPDIETMQTLHLGRDVVLFTGVLGQDQRTEPVSRGVLSWLHASSKEHGIPLLIEADGSRQMPLKAPQGNEPPIPEFADHVVVLAGLSAIGKPLGDEFVHRPELFSRLCGIHLGDMISAGAIAAALTHPNGGCKNIPGRARRTVLLNQADTPELKSQAQGMVAELLPSFDSVIIGSLREEAIQAAYERSAAIILAAGASTRYGQPKQLLSWRGNPFVRSVALTAFEAGITQVTVVTGASADQVEEAIAGLPVTIVRNQQWLSGQASSIRAGLRSLPPETGSAIFLLADQPHVTPAVVRSLVETHAAGLPAIVAPLVQGERRANPVLFDRIAFPDLEMLNGDVGGRAIFSKYRVEYMPWHDERLLSDVDKPEDYDKLLHDDAV